MAKITKGWLISNPEVEMPTGRYEISISAHEATELERKDGFAMSLRLDRLDRRTSREERGKQWIELLSHEVNELAVAALANSDLTTRRQALRLLISMAGDSELLDAVADVRQLARRRST
jgi:hypothetical protein